MHYDMSPVFNRTVSSTVVSYLQHVSVLIIHVALFEFLVLCQSDIWSRLLPLSVLTPAGEQVQRTRQRRETDEAETDAVSFAVEVSGVGRREDIGRNDTWMLSVNLDLKLTPTENS